MPPKRKRAHFADDIGHVDEELHVEPQPATGTDAVIESALEQEERERERAKALKQAKDDGRVDVEEVEREEEDGTVVLPSRIKENRMKRRKARSDVEDTELLPTTDVAQIEEELEVEEEDGIQLEPFNLHAERTEGRFDDSGHYIENAKKDEVNDAWLGSEEATQVSEQVRKAVAERERAMAAAEDAPAMSTVQMAQLKRTIAEVLQPGETVTRGLQRLGTLSGSRRPGKKRPASGNPKEAAAQPAATPLEQAAAKADFNRLTEAASQLMDSGELDVYSLQQEDFAKAASLFGRPSAGGAAEKDMFADESDDDGGNMFADSDEDAPKSAVAAPGAKAADKAADGPLPPSQPVGSRPSAAAADASTAAAAAVADGTQPEAVTAGRAAAVPAAVPSNPAATPYSSWPIKELRRFLQERRQDTSNIVEKEDLVQRVRAAAAVPPAGETSAAASVPAGYEHDPATGYYYSSDSRLYYDTTSGGFFSQDDGSWYAYDAAAQQFVPWPKGEEAKVAEAS